MHFSDSITARIFVWLAAVFVPVDALPLLACDCGSHSPQTGTLKSGLADASPAAKCPHCAVRSQPARSCCGAAAASSAQHRCCCCGSGPCHGSGKGKVGSHGEPCRCAANKSGPDPAPLPGNSRPESTKGPLGSSLNSVTTVAVLVPSMVPARVARQPSHVACTSLERLSALCRLIV